jgi:hypothetical protein
MQPVSDKLHYTITTKRIKLILDVVHPHIDIFDYPTFLPVLYSLVARVHTRTTYQYDMHLAVSDALLQMHQSINLQYFRPYTRYDSGGKYTTMSHMTYSIYRISFRILLFL